MRRIDAAEIDPRYPDALVWFDTACPHLAVADGTRFYERVVPARTVNGEEHAEQWGKHTLELVAVATLPDYRPIWPWASRYATIVDRGGNRKRLPFESRYQQVEARWDPPMRVWLRYTEYFDSRAQAISGDSRWDALRGLWFRPGDDAVEVRDVRGCPKAGP